MRTDLWNYPEGTTTPLDIQGFKVRATDGEIGKIDEATYDVGSAFIVVDTGPWILGRKVRSRPGWPSGSTSIDVRLRFGYEGPDQERARARRGDRLPVGHVSRAGRDLLQHLQLGPTFRWNEARASALASSVCGSLAPPTARSAPPSTPRTPRRRTTGPRACAPPRPARGSAPSLGDHRVGEPDHVDALLEHRLRHPSRQRRVAEHHGHDRMLARQHVEPGGLHLGPEEPRVVLEPVAELRGGRISSIAFNDPPTTAGAIVFEKR